MRTEYLILIEKELELIQKLSNEVISQGYDASNTIVVTVSSDYSAIIGQLMRHNLSFEGEIAHGFSVDVPYPDQTWDSKFIYEAKNNIQLNAPYFGTKTLLLVEAGVIRGSNYQKLIELIRTYWGWTDIKTLALFENIHSVFKSDYVGEYYDNETQDLTFQWERKNNHWK